jgi:hypothetical protein
VYVDDLAFGDRPTERGAWRDRLAQLDAELSELEARSGALGAGDPARLASPTRPHAPSTVRAVSDDAYEPGSEVVVSVTGAVPSSSVELHHRPLDQSAEWSVVVAPAGPDGTARLVVPASATRSPYPLSWYVVADGGAGPAIHPGLGEDLCARPYAVLAPNAQ